jgi:hypothetical protein
MLCRVAFVRTDILEEHVASIIRLQHASVDTANNPSSPILVTLIMEAISSSKTSVLARTTQRTIPKDSSLHSISLQCVLVICVTVQVFGNDSNKPKFDSGGN